MSKVTLNLIAAACENMGIGTNGTLPWKLKNEMAYFTTMTSKVKDPAKVNAVIMGRRTWDCIPDKYRPLSGRVNVVLTHHVELLKEKVPQGVIVVPGLDEAISYIEGRPDIESTWVIGGSSIYSAAMEHPNCGKIYLTEIQKSFDCDTFFPNIDKQQFHIVDEEEVPGDRQMEGDISYYFRVPQGVIVVPGLDEAISYIEGRPDIESTWVIGGSSIYSAAMEHPNCGKIYLTEIQKSFDCDTFFPNIDKQQFHIVDEEEVPGDRQMEGDISYYFRVYKRL